MRQHPGHDDGQDGPHARRHEHLPDGQALAILLPRIVGHGQQYPGNQHDGQARHDAEDAAPAQHTAHQGPQGHAQRQGQRRADHGDGHRPALLLHGHHAARVTGHQPPGQPGGHAGQETGNEGNEVMRRQGRHRIEHQEAADGQQQHVAPAPAARQRREGNGRQDGTDGVDGHELARHDFGNAEVACNLRQQAGRQGFRQEGKKRRHGQGQQGQDGNGRVNSSL